MRLATVGVVLGLLAALAGCGGSDSSGDNGLSYIATAAVAQVPIHSSPNGPVTQTLPNPTIYGAPLTFLVASGEDQPWVKVFLPVRPNGSTGYVDATQVHIQENYYRLDVLLKAHQLKVYDSGELVDTYPIAVGTKETPTPGGTYYLRVLLRPPNPNTAYGVYAYGLSGFSPVLNDFAGGDGIVGLHGTNDPSSIGHDVSHGCIRLRNQDITKLAEEYKLPLGTPVRILA